MLGFALSFDDALVIVTGNPGEGALFSDLLGLDLKNRRLGLVSLTLALGRWIDASRNLSAQAGSELAHGFKLKAGCPGVRAGDGPETHLASAAG